MIDYPKVASITLSYNFSKFAKNYFDSFSNLNYPAESLTQYLHDNASKDDSIEIINQYIGNHKYKIELSTSKVNTGFSGGNNIVLKKLLKESDAKYFFLLNQDTQIDPECLKLLVEEMERSPKTGMLEARQEPREHPKCYDPVTFETYWCSGGGVLIRKEVLEKIGVFDHRYFLYSEDVDLSWRTMIAGYQCRVCPEATYYHFTEDLDPNKDLSYQYYYNFRNSFFMHYKYDSILGILKHYYICAGIIYKNKHDKPRYKAFIRAYINAQKFIPSFLITRLKTSRKNLPKWIIFNHFDYEKRRPFKDTPDGRIFLDENKR